MKSKIGWRLGVVSSVVVLLIFGLLATGYGKEVLRATGVTPGKLTPGNMAGSAEARLAGAVYDWLVRVKPGTMAIKPELAKSWDVSSDGKKWKINLREDVKFHDGTKFGADDVVFTIERALDPDVGHALRENFRIIDNIEKLGEYTVEVTLNESNAKFMHMFTDYNAAVLSSEYDYDEFGETKPMGTGPFMVDQIRPRESAILVKNPEYWVEDTPRVDEIHWSFVPDKSTQLQMLKTGSVDMAMEITPQDVVLLQGVRGVDGMHMKGTTQIVLFMRSDKKPFEDNRVRLALKYTIDDQQMLQSSYGLLYDKIKDDVTVQEHPIAPVYPEYTELEKRERDIQKAKDLLAEAGYPDGVELELYYASNYRVGPQAAIALQQMAKPAGFDIKLIGLPRDVYLSKYWRNVNFGITGWGNRVDPVALLKLAYKSGAPWNESHYSNEKLDELISQIAGETDFEKRKELYKDMETLFQEEGPVVTISIGRWHGISENVKDYLEAATFYGDWRLVTLTGDRNTYKPEVNGS